MWSIVFLFINYVVAFKHYAVTNNPNHINVQYLNISTNYQLSIIQANETEWRNSLKLDYYKLELEKIPYNEIVLLTDSFDVILIDNYDSIINKFLEFSVDILISAESKKWPSYVKNYNNKELVFPYLNSGAIIGYAGPILNTIQRGYDISHGDQYSWTIWYLEPKNNITIVLDHNNDIFISMFKVSNNDIQKHPFKHKYTTGYPKIIHFNGHKNGYINYVKEYVLNK